MSQEQDIEVLISEANALVESVYRDLAMNSPARGRARSTQRVNGNYSTPVALSPGAQRQIEHLNNVMASVDENLRQVDNDESRVVEIVETTSAPLTQNDSVAEFIPSETSGLPALPRRTCSLPPQQDAVVVIDLCADSPQNNDVILVPHIVPGVVNLESPVAARPARRRTNGRSRLATSPTSVPLAAQDLNATTVVSGLQCPICLEDFSKRQPSATTCGHMFCKDCIRQAIDLTRKCPICKRKLTGKSVIRLYM